MRSSTYKMLICLVIGILIGRFWTLKSPVVQLDHINGKAAVLLTGQLLRSERALNEYLEQYYRLGTVTAGQYTDTVAQLQKSSMLLQLFLNDMKLDLRNELNNSGVVASRAKFLWDTLDILAFRLPLPTGVAGTEDKILEEQIQIIFSTYEYLFGEYPGSAFSNIDRHRSVGELIDQCCTPEWQTLVAFLHESWPQAGDGEGRVPGVDS